MILFGAKLFALSKSTFRYLVLHFVISFSLTLVLNLVQLDFIELRMKNDLI